MAEAPKKAKGVKLPKRQQKSHAGIDPRKLHTLVAEQAAAYAKGPTACRRCPGCQQPLACPDTNERIVATRAGEAGWAEPEGYCDRCRRSFFPSVQEPGP